MGLGLSARSIQRWKKNLDDKRKGPKTHPKKLSAKEEARALKVLNSERFCDLNPNVIVPMLAETGQYICSASTMYKLLKRQGLSPHRGRSKQPEKYPKIETIASKPNEVWCWDITHLPTLVRGQTAKLYMFEDVFSRKIVGWQLSHVETDQVSWELFSRCLKNEKITGKALRLHNDNGIPMRASTFVAKIKSLGVIQSFSRPAVKDDNPFAEAVFKTMKYCPKYPYRAFEDIEHAKRWVESFVEWYNNHHRHSRINYVTPAQRHTGEDKRILKRRRAVFAAAKKRNPNRWTRHSKTWLRAEHVSLNPHSCRLRN